MKKLVSIYIAVNWFATYVKPIFGSKHTGEFRFTKSSQYAEQSEQQVFKSASKFSVESRFTISSFYFIHTLPYLSCVYMYAYL